MSLQNKVVVFSGFRDPLLAERITSAGGIVKTSMVNATNLLVYKKSGKAGTKVDEAKKRGIEVIELEDFMQKYFTIPKLRVPSPPSPHRGPPPPPPSKLSNKKCQYITLPQLSNDYENNNWRPPMTVAQVESLTKKNLFVGDIVNFFNFRDVGSYLVTKDRSFISAKSENDNLIIPLEITKHLSDALKFYSDLLEDEAIDSIELGITDPFIKKIKTDLDAQFTFMPNDKELSVKYKNQERIIRAPITAKKIDDAFKKQENKSIKVYAKIILVNEDNDNNIVIDMSPTTLKKIFGTKATFKKDFGKSYIVNGDFNLQKVQEKLSDFKI